MSDFTCLMRAILFFNEFFNKLLFLFSEQLTLSNEGFSFFNKGLYFMSGFPS